MHRLTYLAVAAAAFGLLVPSVTQVDAAKKKKPGIKFTAKKLTPKTAPGGRSASASVRIVASGGLGVTAVSLRLQRAGSVTSLSAMTHAGNGNWRRTFTVPAQYTGKSAIMEVWVDAQTTIGPRSTRLGSIKVMPTVVDPNTPPPPPPI
jgi:hypothetical protein